MAAGSSRVPALIDYLVALFAGAGSLGEAPAPNTVTVFDGPATTELDPFLKLYVGLQDPDADTVQVAASLTQSRADMGNATRSEQIVVFCVAEAWSGDDTISAVRHSVFGIVAAVEALVRADNTVGGLGFQAPGVTAGDLQQNNTARGAIARVPFTITVKSFT